MNSQAKKAKTNMNENRDNNLNLNQLAGDRRAVEDQIRALKSVLRTTWTRDMAAEQRELVARKREATELCVLRAWARGRWHLADHDRCREIAERRAPEYRVLARPEVA